MKENNINKLMAEFLDLDLWRDEEICYNSSFSLLMQVVEKIEQVKINGDWFAVEICQEDTTITIQTKRGGTINLIHRNADTKIESVYLASYDFIVWYNEKLKS